MNDDHASESDVSDEAAEAPEGVDTTPLQKLEPTADSDIAGDLDGAEPGYTFPGPGA